MLKKSTTANHDLLVFCVVETANTPSRRIFSRAGTQTNQQVPLIYVMSRFVKQLRVRHVLEEVSQAAASHQPTMDIAVTAGEIRLLIKHENVFVDGTVADHQTAVLLRGRIKLLSER